jgi:hypothetical protein
MVGVEELEAGPALWEDLWEGVAWEEGLGEES